MTTVKEINRVRSSSGSETIAVVTTDRFTEQARKSLEQQGVACVTISKDAIKEHMEKRKGRGE
ncbi:hypothetical protein [Azospirillum oleiclasticum]|uniref:hypothetical protein n=1 Tax=Azospirillum oleiclasticum TaxID=2735135 RepID=UPI003CCD46EE